MRRAASLQGRLFLSNVQVLLVLRPRCIFDRLGHRATVDACLQGAPVRVERRACLNIAHFLYLRVSIKFKKVVTYIVGIGVEPGHHRIVLYWRHVFHDSARLALKILREPTALLGAAERDQFLVDDLEVAQVIRIARAVRLVGGVRERLLAAVRVCVGAGELVVLSLGQGLESPSMIVLQEDASSSQVIFARCIRRVHIDDLLHSERELPLKCNVD